MHSLSQGLHRLIAFRWLYLKPHQSQPMKINASHAIASAEPTEGQIQHQAYMLWQAGGCQEGRELDDWLHARELLRHHQGFAKAAAKARARTPKRATQ